MKQIPIKVDWLSQRDNKNPFTGKAEPSNQCMVASFTMMMRWLNKYLIASKEITEEWNYNEATHYIVVGKSEALAQKVRFQSANHAKPLNVMLESKKIPYYFKQVSFDYADLVKYITDNQRPVLIGTMETASGHIVVCDGLIQNPYGRPEGTVHAGSCRYVDPKGKDLEYLPEFFTQMVFREMANGRTSAVNVMRPCWIIERRNL